MKCKASFEISEANFKFFMILCLIQFIPDHPRGSLKVNQSFMHKCPWVQPIFLATAQGPGTETQRTFPVTLLAKAPDIVKCEGAR